MDVWRLQHPTDQLYTWYRKNPTKIFCRLDFFLISFCLVERIESASITHGFDSDHSSINLTFIPHENKRGRGYWKLNCSLLSELEYVTQIKTIILESIDINKEADPGTLWETIKCIIRGHTIKYSSQRKKRINSEVANIESKLQDLQSQLSINHEDTDNIIENIELLKYQLKNKFQERTQGAIVRSRTQWYEEGEKNSNYFFNLEKRQSSNKTIHRLRLSDNTITQSPDKILAEQKQFYKNLYKCVNENQDSNFLQEIKDIPTIPDDIKHNMEVELTETELLKVLKSMDNNKSPGEDGYPAEFYKVFWVDIKSILVKSYKYAYENGGLSISQKRGIISLIPKKEKDPIVLKNWRPLSLLNVDYKMLAKTIASRIKTSLNHIVHDNQTGYIKNRYIGQNIASIYDVIHYTETENIPALLIAIDFEKAFDCLDWNFLQSCMTRFGFPNVILNWVKTLYTDIKSCVINNGSLSEYFPIERGVRQGCPLSPYLFIIAVEILAIAIRDNKNINGIAFGNIEQKISQYADDTCLTIHLCQESLIQTFDIFNRFGKDSGLKINYDKTEILRIGSIRHSNCRLYTKEIVSWTNDPIAVLGIKISATDDCEKLNIHPLMSKMDNIIKVWSWRRLTLFGKVTIINTLLISQLVYRLTVLPRPSDATMKKIDKTLFDYMWNNKPHKIAKKVISNFPHLGGIKMPNIYLKDDALKCSWVVRILRNPPYTVCPSLDYYCYIAVKELLQCNLASSDVSYCWRKKPSQLWIDMLKAWCKFNYKTSDQVNSSDQWIWFNSNIKVGNKPI